jgi:hypothetical protein
MFIFESDSKFSEPLTNVSIGFTADASEYVATRVFPVVPVKKQSGTYYSHPRGEWFRTYAQVRGPGQETPGIMTKLAETGNYYCKVYGVHQKVDDFERANFGSVFDLDKQATQRAQNDLLLRRELDFLATYFVPGKWGLDSTPSPKWDAANATIIADIREAAEAIKTRTGLRPNKLVVQEKVWNRILDAADIIDRIRGGATSAAPATVNAQLIAGILGLDEIIIAGAIQNTATPDLTPNFSFAAGNHALLIHVPRAPGIFVPSAGYTFVWTELFGVGPQGERVLKMREDLKRCDRIEAELNYAHGLVAPDCGVLIRDVLTV